MSCERDTSSERDRARKRVRERERAVDVEPPAFWCFLSSLSIAPLTFANEFESADLCCQLRCFADSRGDRSELKPETCYARD